MATGTLSAVQARVEAIVAGRRGDPGTSLRPCRVFPALAGALLLGLGAGCGITVVRWRAAAVQGQPDLPAAAALLLAVAGLCGLLASGAGLGPRAAGLLAGVSAAGAAVLALLAEWALAGRAGAPGGYLVAMAVPSLLVCLAIGLAARAHASRAVMLAALLLGAGTALWLAPHVLAATGLASGLRIAAVLVLAASGLLAVRGFPPAAAPCARGGAGLGALLAAALGFAAPLLLDGARAAGTAVGAGEGSLLLGLALGILLAAAWNWHERRSGLLPALCLVMALAGGAFRAPLGSSAGAACLSLALLGAAAGPVLLAAVADSGRCCGTALLVGLGLAVLGRLWAPALSSAALPWLVPLTALLGGLLLLRLSWLALMALALGAAMLPFAVQARAAPPVAAVYGAEVRWLRADQGLELHCDGVAVDCAGPGRRHGELLAHLGRLLCPAATHTAVLGLGTGRAVTALAAWRDAGTVELVSSRPAALRLWSALQDDGPVAPGPLRSLALPHGMRLQQTGLRSYLTALPPDVLDLVLMPEPVQSSEPWLATEEFHALVRSRLGRGLLLQAFRCDQVTVPLLRSALAAAGAVHPWCGLFLWGDAAVLAAAGQALDLEAAGARLQSVPAELRWLLHRAGLGAGVDLELAFLGTLRPCPAGSFTDDASVAYLLARKPPAGTAAVAVLRAAIAEGTWSEAGRARLRLRDGSATERTEAARALAALLCEHPDSVLLRAEGNRYTVAEAVLAITALDPADPGSAARAATKARGLLHLGCPAPVLQAALALPDRIGHRLREPAAAAALAAALDPTFAERPPAVLAGVLQDAPRQSPLEDFAALPPDESLAGLCAGDQPLAVALRVRFPSDCARALVGLWQRGPLPAPAGDALRELADPFVLDAAAQALGQKRRRELLALWRFDLPLPGCLAELARGELEGRVLLAEALPCRRDRPSLLALAELLADPERTVRLPAAAALLRSLGDKIAYDPDWPEVRLRQAADQVRALHNRAP